MVKLQLSDRISAAPRGDVATVMAFAKQKGAYHQEDVQDYLAELWRLCKKHGFDFSILAAQSANETGNWGELEDEDGGWRKYRNPAGIGITNSQNLSLGYQSGKDAARAHVVHMWVYNRGAIPEGHELAKYIPLDPRYSAALNGKNTLGNGKPFAKYVQQLKDLNANGMWAWLDNPKPKEGDFYGDRIIDRGTEIWGSRLPAQTAAQDDPEEESPPVAKKKYGRVPKPDWIDMIVPKQQEGQGFTYGARDIVCSVPHETQGLGAGPWYYDFFSCPNGERCKDALVDFLIDTQGKLFRFNDPYGNRVPYASGGPVNQGNEVGKAFYKAFGDAARNTRCMAVEFVKTDAGMLTEAQIQTGAKLFAWIADVDEQPFDEWPNPTKYNRAPVFPDHGDIAVTTCHQDPAQKRRLTLLTQTIMQKWQEDGDTTPVDPPVTPPSTPAEPVITPGVDNGIAEMLFNSLYTEGQGYSFNPDGPVSKAWLERCLEEGAWPSLVKVKSYENGARRYFIFANGWVFLVTKKESFWVGAEELLEKAA